MPITSSNYNDQNDPPVSSYQYKDGMVVQSQNLHATSNYYHYLNSFLLLQHDFYHSLQSSDFPQSEQAMSICNKESCFKLHTTQNTLNVFQIQ